MHAPWSEARQLDRFLEEIVDTRVKLDVLVCLHRAGAGAVTTATIAERVEHGWIEVAEALSELSRAGVVATANDDGAGWGIDPESSWVRPVAMIARIHEHDRPALLRLISRLALRRLRAASAPPEASMVRKRLKLAP